MEKTDRAGQVSKCAELLLNSAQNVSTAVGLQMQNQSPAGSCGGHKVAAISSLLAAQVDIKVDEEHPSYS